MYESFNSHEDFNSSPQKKEVVKYPWHETIMGRFLFGLGVTILTIILIGLLVTSAECNDDCYNGCHDKFGLSQSSIVINNEDLSLIEDCNNDCHSSKIETVIPDLDAILLLKAIQTTKEREIGLLKEIRNLTIENANLQVENEMLKQKTKKQ